jgi:hypothetical protein
MGASDLNNPILNPVQNDQAPSADVAPAISIVQNDQAPSSSISPTMSISLSVLIQTIFPVIGGHHVIQSDGGDI